MKETPKWNRERLDALQKKFFLSPLAKCLLEYLRSPYYSYQEKEKFLQELEKAARKSLRDMKTADEFYCSALRKAVTQLTDKALANDIRELIELSCRGQFSSTMFRKSYVSADFRYYAGKIFDAFKRWVQFYFYETSVEDLLLCDAGSIGGFDDFVALEINRGNRKVMEIIREMILGDNNVHLSTAVITGIVKSDNWDLKKLLKDLLLAAKGQEGLRQSILDHVDAGDLQTFRFFFQCCVENDLFRFSAAARSFYTWTGVYHDNIDIKFSRAMAQVAWDCLSDKEKRAAYYESDNPYEVYLSVWASGCEEITDTQELINNLLKSDKLHKQFLAWYFVHRVENAAYKHAMAVAHLETDDMRLLGLATDCLHRNNKGSYGYLDNNNQYEAQPMPDSIYPKDIAERRGLFDRLALLVEKMGKKTWNYPAYLFPWTDMTVDNDHARVLDCMISLAVYDIDDYMIDRLHDLQEYMNVDRRMAFYIRLLQPEINQRHREYILEGLKDKALSVKNVCIHKLMNCAVRENDVNAICAMFSTKSGDLRKLLMKYLSALDTPNKQKAIEKLMAGGENHIQAAVELVLNDETVSSKKEILRQRLMEQKLSDQTQLLVNQLFPENRSVVADEDEISEQNGYGLFDPAEISRTVEEFSCVGDLGKISEKDWLSVFPTVSEQEKLFERLNAVIEARKDYEYCYLNYADEKVTTLLGNGIYLSAEHGNHGKMYRAHQIRMEMLPFGEEFKAVIDDFWDSRETRFAWEFMCRNQIFRRQFEHYLDWIKPFAEKYTVRFDEKLSKKYGNRFEQMLFLLNIAFQDASDDETAMLVLDRYLSLYRILGKENIDKAAQPVERYNPHPISAGRVAPFVTLRSILRGFNMGDDVFHLFFCREYARERTGNFDDSTILEFSDFVRAIDLGIIRQEHLCDWLVCPGENSRRGNLAILTTLHKGRGKDYAEKYPWFKELSEKTTHNLVLFESRRGQADTSVSRIIKQIGRIYGADYFVLLLKALGSEGFFRGYQWSADTKQAILSILLRKCYPAQGDTVETLAKLLQDTGITEKRLIEAAMYAPQWAPFIEEITGWKGLKKAVWFFHAHVSEQFSSDKETEVALYSPISHQKFNDGLFDADWFRESYAELGEKRFAMLHRFAKYITSGSNTHKRSQLFADASSGKIDEAQLEQEIKEKRNQERIRAYAIIPLEQGNIGQLLHRYEFISNYMKESKQFGAQRRENERKAGNIALENLAVTCGLFDVNRMLWKLEKAKNQEILPLMEKQEILGYTLWLNIDSEGDASVQCEKDGKRLKSLPKVLAKNEYAEQLKQKVKELKNQKARSRESLENAMIGSIAFTADDLCDLLDSFTIAPMACHLVWTDGEHLGFPEREGDALALRGYDGQTYPLNADSRLLIAHPYHFACAGCWSDYMHMVYEQHIIQPFKQVFREYYPITAEEKEENTVSRRYAGYQVQPAKTAALLRGRGWTVDYEDGWQKVNYRNDIVVRLYAYADWFTAADIEPPTLEKICFFNRKTEESVPLTAIDPVCFSEIMRDLDMVVSVAYVGGVDAETSHSTVEMRRAIARELCGLMKLDNVEFLDKHAKVYGKLSEYSVHLGSGIVHSVGRGAINILPVHSQHRGRIFLPFADEDPKTAEIMSKIILLAEDHKIKDPTILDQLM